jgi:amidase
LESAAAQLYCSTLSYPTVVTFGIMVSASFLTKVFVAFVPLTSVVYAQYNVSVPQLPLLLDATADELIAGLEAGSFTSLDLVQVRIKHKVRLGVEPDIPQAYVGRIIEVNKTLHMVAEINPDAWSIAKELDEERACGKSRG